MNRKSKRTEFLLNEIFCSIIHLFTLTFDNFNASVLNTNISFFQINNCTDPKSPEQSFPIAVHVCSVCAACVSVLALVPCAVTHALGAPEVTQGSSSQTESCTSVTGAAGI